VARAGIIIVNIVILEQLHAKTIAEGGNLLL
jgi:hypothetical protein